MDTTAIAVIINIMITIAIAIFIFIFFVFFLCVCSPLLRLPLRPTTVPIVRVLRVRLNRCGRTFRRTGARPLAPTMKTKRAPRKTFILKM